jgi:Protein of unknown function (DUF3102)
MEKLVVVPMRRAEELPKWSAPKNLGEAATTISQLGRNMHEHAYIIGKTLLWVKQQVGHGKFLSWLQKNVWFGQRTARYMMKFAQNCAHSNILVEYHGYRAKPAFNADLAIVKAAKKDSDPRPIELRCYFEIEHRLREVFFDLTKDQQTDLLLSIRELLKNLESESAKGADDL